MTTENINIVIREDGSRVVVRNIQDMGTAAQGTDAILNVLKRTLAAVGAALAVDKLKEYADEWASVTGIVEVATKSHTEAVAVLNNLFAAAQAVRTPIDEMAQLYGRVNRASQDLGASQAEAIQFTKEVGQALVVQHTTATQASGALLQLGQLLGTGKIRAQEFNSVNENLSVVLQVVARNIDGAGGSINRLKTLVENGTVTSKAFFEAFLKGSDGLQRDFDKSAFTIGQGFTLIHNAVLKMIGDLNNATGASNAFGQGAKFVADHMNEIEDAVVNLTKVLAAGAAGWVAYSVATGTATGAARLAAFLEEINAVAKGTVVILGSAEAERQKAVAAQQSALAESVASIAARERAVAEAAKGAAITEAATADAVARNSLASVMRISAAAELAEASAAELSATRHLQAAESAGALSFALAEAKIATLELATAEAARDAALTSLIERTAVEVATEEAVTAALVAQTEAQATLTSVTLAGDAAITAANGRLIESQGAVVAATAAAAGTTGRLAQIFAGLKGFIAPVVEAAVAFFAAINAHPIIALITALVVATGLLLGFGNSINAGIDSITTLGDVTTVVKSKISSTFSALGSELSEFWKSLTDNGNNALGQVSSAAATEAGSFAASFTAAFATNETGWARWLIIVARIIDELAGIVAGTVGAIAYSFKYVWTSIEEGAKAFIASQLSIFQDFVNLVIDGLNQIRDVKIDHVDVASLFKPDPHAFDEIGGSFAEALGNGFDKGLNAEGGKIEKALTDTFKQAQLVAIGRLNSASGFNPDRVDLGVKGKVAKTPIDPKEIKAAESALRELLDKINPAQGAVLELAKAHDVLTRAQKDGLITQAQVTSAYADAKAHYADIIDPLNKYMSDLAQSTNLLDLDARQRGIEGQVEAEVAKQKKANNGIGLAEIDIIRSAITAHQDYADVVAEEDSIISGSVGARKQYADQLTAIQNLLAHPATKGKDFTKDDAAEQLLKTNQELLAGTSIYIQGTTAKYKQMYGQIAQLRAHDLIDDKTANQLRARADALTATQTFEAFKQAAIDANPKEQWTLNNADLLQGTTQLVDAQVSEYKRMFAEIKEARALDLIDDKTANQLKGEAIELLAQQTLQAQTKAAQARLNLGDGSWADSQLVALQKFQNGFTTFTASATSAMGDFFDSFTSGFADSIGKAITGTESFKKALHDVAQQALSSLIAALIKAGIQWVIMNTLRTSSTEGSVAATTAAQVGATATISTTQAAALSATVIESVAAAGTIAVAWADAAAMVSLASYGANAIPASAAIVETVGLSEGLALGGFFKDGGYTGSVGVDEVAGVVHGQEFVMNADATSRNRDLLEAMNRGANVRSLMPVQATQGKGGSSIAVHIENHGSGKEFEVQQLTPSQVRIIARDEVVKSAPNVVAKHLVNPNSTVSKAVKRHMTTTTRR